MQIVSCCLFLYFLGLLWRLDIRATVYTVCSVRVVRAVLIVGAEWFVLVMRNPLVSE